MRFAALVLCIALGGAVPTLAVETPLGEDGGGAVIDNGAALLDQPDDDRELQLETEDDAIMEALPPPEDGARLDAAPTVVARAGGR